MATDRQIEDAMRENKRRRLASQERKDQARRFAAAYLTEPNIKTASDTVGVSTDIGRQLLHAPEAREIIEEGLSNAARAAGISTEWLIKQLVSIVERCTQVEQVYDRDGNPTGEYAFDSKGAIKALELLGKHMKAFNYGDKSAAAELGNAVIRVLAQEAQAGRMMRQHTDVLDADAVPAEKGPSTGGPDPLAPGSALGPPANEPSGRQSVSEVPPGSL